MELSKDRLSLSHKCHRECEFNITFSHQTEVETLIVYFSGYFRLLCQWSRESGWSGAKKYAILDSSKG